MKRLVAFVLTGLMVIGLAACGKQMEGTTVEETDKETAVDSAEVMTEEEAAAARDAGTLESDAFAGYEYNESTGNWYYSNYPNYKDFMADGVIKVGFVSKMSGVWFTPKSENLKAVCEEHGYEYLFIDANNDEQAWLDGVQNIINQDFDIAVLCAVNTALLPDAIAMLQEAGMAYFTADDPGVDAYEFTVPHHGLDDYALYSQLGDFVIADLEERGFWDDISEDYSNFRWLIADAPSLEGLHKRNMGFYEKIMELHPNIPEDRITWLDCGTTLADESIEKLTPAIQADKGKVDKWMISGPSDTILAGLAVVDENNIDFADVAIVDAYGSAVALEAVLQSEDRVASTYGVGLIPGPSGTAIGNIIVDLVENGTPIPSFTGYDFIGVGPENTEEFYNEYFK